MYLLISFCILMSSNLFADVPAEKKNPFDLFPLEEPHAADPIQEGRFLGEFFYMLLMLGMLIGAVLMAGYFLRRLTTSRMEALNTSSRIKILEGRSLSQRSQVHLIEIDDKEFLIAESPNGITALALENSCADRET